jgi:hypothetical protein
VTPCHKRKNNNKRGYKNGGSKFFNLACSDRDGMAEFSGHSDEYVDSISSGDAFE